MRRYTGAPVYEERLLRIIVVGTSCSGKTTFARQVSENCGIQHIELDALFWGPNWTPSSRTEFRERISQEIAREEWILDGNYSYTQEVTWPRATHLVWLNLPFRVVLYRAMKRTFGRMITGEEMYAGNRETFRNALSRDSIIWWVISTYARRRKRYREIVDGNRHPKLIIHEVTRSLDAERVIQQICSD